MPPVLPALATSAAAAVVGLLTGVLGSVAHGRLLALGPLDLPVGLVVAGGLVLAADLALRSSAPPGAPAARLPVVVSGAVRLLVVLALAAPRPEGDLVVPGTLRGLTWVLLASLLPVAVALWPSPRGTGAAVRTA